MKILHYLLGTPPVRGGGLVKYALDLAEAQSQEDEVLLLLPGSISFNDKARKKIQIKKTGNWKDIPQYKIYNALPIPMGNGILDIGKFTLPCDGRVYRDFLLEVKPDVIHIHSLMGLHREFLVEAKSLNIPIIYTTHDYFGICPTVNLLYRGCECQEPGLHCGECSKYAFSEKRLLLEQSKVYRMYRSSHLLIEILRMNFLKNFMKKIRSQTPEKASEPERNADANNEWMPTGDAYAVLLAYYREMFGYITCFHFNSNVTRQIYEQHLGKLPGKVISISNKSVSDKRRIHESKGKLKIGFLGGDVAFKGLYCLQKVIAELYEAGKEQIELQVYGSLEKKEYPFCKYYDAYSEEERDEVFGRMDILAVPSTWRETFGLVVLEALSYGVPVIMTDKVGAKILLEESDDKIGEILPDEEWAWKECLEDLYKHREKIGEYSKNICQENVNLEYNKHVEEMKKMLISVVENRLES